jgi:hypothetical protein
MIEAALLRLGEEWDEMRVDLSLRQLQQWYVGDGHYGDGPEFHWDYYNSFVMQPFLVDILEVLRSDRKYQQMRQRVLRIARRYAVIQERLISPEGTYPPIGRSLAYRFGAFQVLALMALRKELPQEIKPGQVRSALTRVIQRQIEANGTFDENGWLRIGLVGYQPDIGEGYISTGSCYLCSVGLLPLGLPQSDDFWTSPASPWTSQLVWSGENVMADHHLDL